MTNDWHLARKEAPKEFGEYLTYNQFGEYHKLFYHPLIGFYRKIARGYDDSASRFVTHWTTLNPPTEF